MKEIIVDNFAGGGGASTGIEMAIGRSVDIAINHDENAIAMHSTNHPETLHYCESVFDVDPVVATAGRPVGLAWFSPDCRHFSKAKGSAPVKKEIRGLAWVVIRWALAKRPRVMMLENVEEFKTWGPLLTAEDGTNHPDRSRAGETFTAFIGMLTTGVAEDHPALEECCEVLGINTDSDDARRLVSGLGYVVDHRELRACDYGAPTIRRRFFMVMRCDGAPVVWPEASHADPKSLDVQSGKLAPWRTAAECIDWSIPCPSIFERKRPLAENTLKRIARGIQRFVIDNATPFIVKCNHTSTKTTYDCFRGQQLAEPLQTITKTHGYAVVTPHITKFRTGATGQECDEPLPTITAGTSERPGGNGHALGMVEATLSPFIAGAGGSEYQGKPRAADVPLHTVMKESHSALIALVIARIGQTGFGGDRMAYDACKPLTTVTSKVEHLLVAPVIARQFGNSVGHAADEPNGTITAGGLHIGEVRAFLLKYYGNEKQGVGLDESLHTVTTNDRFGLVTVEGVDYRIVDIGMRMLQPHELYAAQGFPSWYIIDQDYRGTKYAKDKQVARCGNAVPPPFAEALVRANLPEMCAVNKEVAA